MPPRILSIMLEETCGSSSAGRGSSRIEVSCALNCDLTKAQFLLIQKVSDWHCLHVRHGFGEEMSRVMRPRSDFIN